MLRRLLLLALLVLCTVSAGAAAAAAEQAQGDQQKMMEEYRKLLALGPNHDYFKQFVGEWDVKTTTWMTPGAEPAISQNASDATLILGRRFLMTRFSGSIFGQAFEGLQIDGYDNLTKKYLTFWIDNSSTGFYFLDGSRDTTTGVLTETANWPDPMSGASVGVRGVTTWKSADEYVYEMYMTPPGGKEFKSMENVMTRKKAEKSE
jgi:hypothetical protein